ncbi:hypothetical protein AAG906_024489 [Vitis piasezkii]
MEQKMLRILQHCKNIRELKQTHLQIFIHGLQHSDFMLPKLITVSSAFNLLDYAVSIFQNFCNPNVIAYNTMIKCLIGQTHKEALRVYSRMKALMVEANSFTFTFLLKCFETSQALEDGRVIHGEILKLGFGSSVFVQNSLLGFYANCSENLGSAYRVFEEMPERDVISWNSMISAYMTRGEIQSAIGLLDKMPERNIVTWNSVVCGLSKAGNMELAHSVFEQMPLRNEVSWNSMISGYVRIGDVKAAQSIFYQMPEKTVVSWTAMISGYATNGDLKSAENIFNHMPVKNVVSWNAMISGYVHNHEFDQALCVFHHMLINGECRPDQTTLISILSACAHLGSLEHGKWINSYIKKNKLHLSIPLGNALIDMFAKCGDVENAKEVFHHMSKRCIITWTTMVSGLAVNGKCREAINLFDKMCLEGTKPDDVIFIAVLSACTHGGLVEEGKRVFDQMVQEFGIKPRIEHYGCMVDLLDLLKSVTEKIMDQEPSNPSYLTLVSNLSASFGRWEDNGKVPGCSSIQVGNRVHEFLAKDTRHVQRKEIYRALVCLNGQLKQMGLWALSMERTFMVPYHRGHGDKGRQYLLLRVGCLEKFFLSFGAWDPNPNASRNCMKIWVCILG